MHYFITGTAAAVASSPSCSVHCGSRVKRIVDHTTASRGASGHPHAFDVEVDGKERVVHQADAVIVTVPLGVLHANTIAFEPSLPVRVVQSLSRIGYGPLNKVFASFTHAFWSPKRVFRTVGHPSPPLFLWVDVSQMRGSPTLCAFTTCEAAQQVESLTELQLCHMVNRVLDEWGIAPRNGSGLTAAVSRL
jgi:monoamine oxidase